MVFEPPIAARHSLPEEAVRGRAVLVEEVERARETLEPRIVGHLLVFERALGELARAHTAVAEETDLDLAAITRWVAIWEMSGRCISLANALLDQLRCGFGPQTIGTARLMFEATTLLEAFTIAPEPLVRRWLNGGHVSQREARDQVRILADQAARAARKVGRGFEEDPRYEALVSMIGSAGGPSSADVGELVEWLTREEYREHSHLRGGHNDRRGLRLAGDSLARCFYYGPHPDIRVRARYVEEAGHDIERVVIVVGYALSLTVFGPDFQEQVIWKLQQGFDAVRSELPLPTGDG